MGYYENDGKLEIENCNMVCVGKKKKKEKKDLNVKITRI